MDIKSNFLKDLKIVILDDSRAFAEYIRGVVTQSGATATVFFDSMQALQHLKESDADLILTDLEIPGMNGLEFVSTIRSIPKLADVPVLVLTGKEDEQTMVEAISAGADAFAVKSTIRVTLLAHVTALARLRNTFKEATKGKQLSAVQALIGTYKHDFGNSLAIVDGKFKKLLRTHVQLQEDDAAKSVTAGLVRLITTLRQLNELRNYNEIDYAGQSKILKTD